MLKCVFLYESCILTRRWRLRGTGAGPPAPATGWYNHAPRTNNKTNAFNGVLIWAVAHIETLRPDSHRSELALKSKVHDTTRSKHANVARGKIGQKGELVRHEKRRN